jgi:hypothetical protein
MNKRVLCLCMKDRNHTWHREKKWPKAALFACNNTKKQCQISHIMQDKKVLYTGVINVISMSSFAWPLATNRKWNYPNYPLWPGTLPDICVRANWESTESNINQLLIKNILYSGLVSSPIPSICIHFTSFHYISIDFHLFSIHGN